MRAKLIISSILVACYEAIKVNFTFSSIFASYFFILVNKALNGFFAYFLEKLLNDNLILAPLLVVFNISEYLLTWGSPNFLEFLISYTIQLAILMFDRTYYSKGLGIALEKLELISLLLFEFVHK